MSTHDAYQALVIDRGTVIYRHTALVPALAWVCLVLYAADRCTDGDTARALQLEWDKGRTTVRLVRRFNGRELTYQVRTVSVDAKGNLVDVAL